MSKSLTLADAAWLHLEQPNNLMMVSALLLLDRDPDHSRLERIMRERLLAYDRFRMIAVEPGLGLGLPHWQEDPDFSLDRHLVYEPLPNASMETVLERVSCLMSQPLPRSRPLWELRVLEGVQGGAAVLARLHHAIADGIALMRVLLQVAEHEPEPDWEAGSTPPAAQTKTAEGHWARARQTAHEWLQYGHDLAFRPPTAKRLARRGKQATQALSHVLLLPPDADNPLRGQLSERKLAAVSPPLDLETLKQLSKQLGYTVNDVLMATLAGALGRHLRRLQEVPLEQKMRAVVPVDLRQGADQELGNRFGLVFLTLPVGETDPVRRLREVGQTMTELKGSAEALITFELLSAVGMLPTRLEQGIIEWFGNKATAVVTSLRGPEMELYIGTAKLTGLMYWVPQSGQLGLGVSIISYAGQVRVGVASDAGLLATPATLVEDFQAAYDETLSLGDTL